MIDVCLLGCGGMMPLPYRHLTSLMVRLNGSSLLIDCDEGTQIALKKKGWSFKPIDDDGKCREDGAAYPDRAEGPCESGELPEGDRTGASF